MNCYYTSVPCMASGIGHAFLNSCGNGILGGHQADIRKKENMTSLCFRRFVIVAVHAEEISVNSF